MTFEKELILLISSKSSIIYIITDEEQRLEHVLNLISEKIFTKSIYSWDFINGYIGNPNQNKKALKNPIEALEIIENHQSKTPNFFLLKDYHYFLNDSSIMRKIKNITALLKNTNNYIIISANSNQIPNSLYEYINVIYFPLPNYKEIMMEIRKIFQIAKINNTEYITILSNAYKGFSINKIKESLSRILMSQISIKKSIKQIENEKRKIIQQTNILDFYPSKYKLEEIGGLYNLKDWLKKRQYSFSEQAQTYGLNNPKGLLLVGIQGTGKSLSAKAISQEWNMPLLKLDIGKIFASLMGESEIRMRQAIEISEKCAPCILWIDEIDKAFNKNISNNDSNTNNRVLGSLLTWLAEKRTNVFVVATTNTLVGLPTEIIRKGRFDEIFFLDLPKYQERIQILTIHLRKVRPLTWFKYDIEYLSKITNKFSGAEIEQSITDAMYNSFYEEREFTTQDIVDSINQIVPIAFIDEKNILKLQEWAYSGKIRIA
uniref:Uncharacterized AAA domain-containing protein ycf46 n=1 Tax=Campylaephora sungminbooi TaxID=1896769 RepID=A0A1B0TI17_9FLOR|nr:AAA domain-containing protein Ycf46 [Campylaephora sungminbooi]AKU47359.1 AAA domain-containing protein Ycf46 [Campylaephora sungminbooi]ALN11806.1 AAA domain-containing protein Ycf46 [Campylaephora sungminbooi]